MKKERKIILTIMCMHTYSRTSDNIKFRFDFNLYFFHHSTLSAVIQFNLALFVHFSWILEKSNPKTCLLSVAGEASHRDPSGDG